MVDVTRIERALAIWDSAGSDGLKAVVVRHGGGLVAERYYGDGRPDTLHDVRSAGKSVTSLLVGIAIGSGLVDSPADQLSRYLPETAQIPLGSVTIDDLLTMRSGLDAFDADPDSPGNEERLDVAADPIAFALTVPMRHQPGQHYAYNSLTAYLAGLVTERAAGTALDAFAADVLFGPLGITSWRWRHDIAGHTTGQGNLSITARDLAAIGQMVLDDGVHRARRIVEAAWIAASLEPRVPIAAVDRYADSYGYFWYGKVHDIDGEQVPVFFASGNGGNKIYLVPPRSLVVAITSSAYGRPNGQLRSQQILLDVLSSGNRS